MENSENVIDFISGATHATVSFTNRRHINRIKKLHKERTDEFKFFMENEDGSVCATIPLKWIRINPGASPDAPKREMTPEHKEKLLAALEKSRAKKRSLESEE